VASEWLRKPFPTSSGRSVFEFSKPRSRCGLAGRAPRWRPFQLCRAAFDHSHRATSPRSSRVWWRGACRLGASGTSSRSRPASARLPHSRAHQEHYRSALVRILRKEADQAACAACASRQAIARERGQSHGCAPAQHRRRASGKTSAAAGRRQARRTPACGAGAQGELTRRLTCPWRPSPSILQNLIFGTHHEDLALRAGLITDVAPSLR
jgi:hypothetical protein